MNSDSTVSADKSSADAEGVSQPSPAIREDSAPASADSGSPESALGNELVSSDAVTAPPSDSVETADPEPSPALAEQASHAAESPTGDVTPTDSRNETNATDAVPPDGSVGDPQTAAVDPVEAATDTEQQSAANPEQRKLRLNPTLAGTEAKAVPSLQNEAPSAPGPDTVIPDSTAEADSADAEVALSAPPPALAAAPVELPESDALDAQMEAEIAAALDSGKPGDSAAGEGDAEVAQAVDSAADEFAPPSEEDLAEGAKLNGVIQSIHEDNVFLDFGLRQSGVVSKRQFGAKKEPKVGERLQVVVSKIDEEEGLIVCSLPRGAARISGDWNAIVVGQTVECMVTKTNKGGLEVSLSSLRGFMPASQVDIAYVSDLAPFVGQKLTARVTEVNPGRRRLVLSRRAILAEERAELEAELLARIEVGQTCTGRVKTIKDYGAFVDLGGMDGFLHIGQISWTRIENPSEVLSVGQDVEVKILTIEPDKKDPEKKRVGLGMRQLVANPWSSVEDRFPKGSTQSGKVTRTETYGAFIELEPGVEGLVHISELDHQRVKRVTEVLNVGQQTEVQVLEVDRKRKRISLSVKALTAAPEAAADEDLAPGQGQPYERKRQENLKGGIGGEKPGGLFGNPSDFS